MSIFLSKIHDEYNASNHMEYMLDTDDDQVLLPGLETCAPGSKAMSIESGNEFYLTTNNTWTIMPKGGNANLVALEATKNGEYLPSKDEDGFNKVTVNVQPDPPSLGRLTATKNGNYVADDDGYDGYATVEVDVTPVLDPLSVEANGTYTAGEGEFTDIDGFSTVEVHVSGSGEFDTLTTNLNGTYHPAEGYDGFDMVIVDVPTFELIDYQSAPQHEVTIERSNFAVVVVTYDGKLHCDMVSESLGMTTMDNVEFSLLDDQVRITAINGAIIGLTKLVQS